MLGGWRCRGSHNRLRTTHRSKRKVCDARYETPTLQKELFRLFLQRQTCNRNESITQIYLT